MTTTAPGPSPVDIRWKDYIPTPKRHRVYLWVGSVILVSYLAYMIWESYQEPQNLPDKVYNTGVYLLLGILLLLRGLRVHFLRHGWFIQIDERSIRYKMMQWTKTQNLVWSDVAKIRIAFAEVFFVMKNGKTQRVNLDNVPDEAKIEETKDAIRQFGQNHAIPVTM